MIQPLLRHGSRIALLAALIFVVQASLAVWASAAMAAQPTLDIFGNPLCISGEVGAAHQDRDHAKAMDCCALACAGVSLAFERGGGESGHFGVQRAGAIATPDEASAILADAEHDPGNPRAPPQTA